MEFKDRLKEYRKSLKISTQQGMADKLKITRSLYNMLENGARKPSDDVLEKLFLLSNRPAEYWKYGVEKEDYINKRSEFKCLKDSIKQLSEIGLLKSIDDYNKPEVHKVLDAALKADMIHILEKNKINKNK